MNNSKKLLKLTVNAVFIAIIAVMSFTPLGYLKLGAVEISLLAIPVAFGGAIMGVSSGALLGLAFGISSFIQCFGMSAFGTAIMGVSPVSTFIICIIPRILMGAGSALAYKLLKSKNVQDNVSSLISFLTAAVLNTLFFVGSFIVLFGNTELYAGLETQFATTNIVAFFAAFVGLNGLVEAVASGVFGGVVGKVISKLRSQTK
ncbi:MAG: ECF transporter S component [Clostridia bacterium]|nr:ECF transporter S component [Clostridia bacterium]